MGGSLLHAFFITDIAREHLRKIQAWAVHHGEFTRLRGRRRLGKTERVREFLQEQPHGLCFFVSRKRRSDLLAEFAHLLGAAARR